MNTNGTGSSFREGIAWATLAVLAVGYPSVMGAAMVDPTNVWRTVGLFVGLVVFLSVAGIVFGIIFSGSTAGEPDDERDLAIERRSARYSQHVLGAGVAITIGVIFLQRIALESAGFAAAGAELLLDPLLAAHVLIFFFVASECVRLATRGLDYRRGG
jgi:hypothetical protein